MLDAYLARDSVKPTVGLCIMYAIVSVEVLPGGELLITQVTYEQRLTMGFTVIVNFGLRWKPLVTLTTGELIIT